MAPRKIIHSFSWKLVIEQLGSEDIINKNLFNDKQINQKVGRQMV